MEDSSLTVSGMIFMGISWTSITVLLVFSFYKIFAEKKDKITGVPEIESEIDESSK